MEDKKTYAPIEFGKLAIDNDSLMARFRAIKAQIAELTAQADDVKDEILGRSWREELADTLKAGGFDGVELQDSAGVPRLRLVVAYPLRFQGAEFARDHPELHAQYKRRPDKPEIKTTIVVDQS